MNTKNQVRRSIYALLGMAFLTAVDQFTKFLAVESLKDQPAVEIWKGVFELRYTENRGMAFSLFQGKQIAFFILTIVVAALIIYAFFRIPNEKRYRPLSVFLVLILGGAIGNFIDRVRLGYVIDFLYIRLIDFPIFNLADCFITMTAVIAAVYMFIRYNEEDYKRLGL